MKRIEIVCACIMKNNQVLIAKRASEVEDGIWEFPGGKVENNENHEEAILREIKEELNLNIHHLVDLITITDDTKKVPLEVHAYLCEIESGELHLNAHSDMQWTNPTQIDIQTFHSSDMPIIQSIIAYLAKN